MRCSSSLVPSVTVTSACVSPRVNSAEPCVRGSTPTSLAMLRISSKARPSGRRRSFSISSRKMRSFRRSNKSPASSCCSSAMPLDGPWPWRRSTLVVAFQLGIFLGVQRVGQLRADLLLDLGVQFLVDFRRRVFPLLSCRLLATSSRMPATIFLQHSWPNSMASSTSSSVACCAPASTMTMPSSVPATTMLIVDSRVSS